MKWFEYYDRSTVLLLSSLITAWRLYINDISLAIFFIGISDLVDILTGLRIDYFIHHIINIFAWVYWNTLTCTEREQVEPAIWFLLLHELSNIPLSLIYILKKFSWYPKVQTLLKIWFALSFLCIRSYSIVLTWVNITHYRNVFYFILCVLGTLDVYWGRQIISKLVSAITYDTSNKNIL